MDIRPLHLIAAALAASATLAFAQQQPATASAVKEGDATVDNIVKALNADPNFKDTRITVQSGDDYILLTGATTTTEEAERAANLAREQAGDKPVVNAVLPDHETKYRTWDVIG